MRAIVNPVYGIKGTIMARYVIGDIQGCLEGLQTLLSEVGYVPGRDDLWFAGDLVNRGPDSVGVLQYIKALPQARVVLGNHDLHCLALFHTQSKRHASSLSSVVNHPEASSLMAWLIQQPLMYLEQGVLMVHAGLYPQWSVTQALNYAQEVSDALNSQARDDFLESMYGDEPAVWSETLSGWDRLRFITNACVRMRYLNENCVLDFQQTEAPPLSETQWMPWFDHPRAQWDPTITVAFGHWAALKASIDRPYLKALDGGYVWGGHLVAWCPETNERVSVQAL
ncbi:MAG: symmetrical bis(5'-nucleosyl)-tetraphosphatase [Legionellales bacterium]|nr:symmetrical bis(5'-nucleosyl)-tetraphosphatase [Legionellales bacterium]|tara:strand:+ start:143 stop:988 length:846 start_codon:yes stop_codon:yes gene_type:complete